MDFFYCDKPLVKSRMNSRNKEWLQKTIDFYSDTLKTVDITLVVRDLYKIAREGEKTVKKSRYTILKEWMEIPKECNGCNECDFCSAWDFAYCEAIDAHRKTRLVRRMIGSKDLDFNKPANAELLIKHYSEMNAAVLSSVSAWDEANDA
jgi:hypothetical protein